MIFIKKIILLVTMFCCSVLISAQEGSSSYNFLDIPTSTHAFALGGTNIAVIDADLSLVDQNPALLGSEVGMQIGLNYMHWLGASNFAGARYGMAAGLHGAWAFGIQYLNYGTITRMEPDGTAGLSFSPQDVVFTGTYSHDFTDRLRGGINFKVAYSNYEVYDAVALATDIGLNYYDDERDMSLSVVLRNMGGQVKRFNETHDRLPFDIQLGYMQGIGTSPFSVTVTAWNLTKWNLNSYSHDINNPHYSGDTSDEDGMKVGFFSNLMKHLIFGVQYAPSEKFYIGLGYNYKTRADLSNYHRNFLSGFSVGFGLKVKSFALGVAYAQPHKAGSSIMLNFSIGLDEILGFDYPPNLN